eukprot:15476058-Alexandrium_andersonii.AAC.1
MTPATMTAKQSLLKAFMRGSPWPSLGQRGSACATSAWRTRNGAELHVPAAQLHVRIQVPRLL